MALLLRMLTASKSLGISHIVPWARCKFSSEAFISNRGVLKDPLYSCSARNRKKDSLLDYTNGLPFSPFCLEAREHHLEDYKVEIVDDETWQMSSNLAESWKSNANVGSGTKGLVVEQDQETHNVAAPDKDCPDFDEIEDMRIRNDLFYKLDKGSKEYEEYKFDFHGRKSSKNQKFQEESVKTAEKKNVTLASQVKEEPKSKFVKKEMKKEKVSCNASFSAEKYHWVEDQDLSSRMHDVESNLPRKKLRTITFNQRTDAYHEPFCLDIFVSKGSVRASIIHRATSKVVSVAHSISKDLKFDLGSTKSRLACSAVGEVLAKRALDDDIHNVVYTPRKGEQLVGKLQIVLQTIIDYGIDVKVKFKQRKMKKRKFPQELERNHEIEEIK